MHILNKGSPADCFPRAEAALGISTVKDFQLSMKRSIQYG
jgi:hypothetical protein